MLKLGDCKMLRIAKLFVLLTLVNLTVSVVDSSTSRQRPGNIREPLYESDATLSDTQTINVRQQPSQESSAKTATPLFKVQDKQKELSNEEKEIHLKNIADYINRHERFNRLMSANNQGDDKFKVHQVDVPLLRQKNLQLQTQQQQDELAANQRILKEIIANKEPLFDYSVTKSGNINIDTKASKESQSQDNKYWSPLESYYKKMKAWQIYKDDDFVHYLVRDKQIYGPTSDHDSLVNQRFTNPYTAYEKLIENGQNDYSKYAPGISRIPSDMKQYIDLYSPNTGKLLYIPTVHEQEQIHEQDESNKQLFDYLLSRPTFKKLPEILKDQLEQQNKYTEEGYALSNQTLVSRDFLRARAFCNTRNLIKLRPLGDYQLQVNEYLNRHSTVSLLTTGADPNQAQVQMGKLVQVKSNFGQYPSHVGIYNNLKPEDSNNFLCAGTWISHRFILTLASCVKDKNGSLLVVTLNEWNSFKSNADNSDTTIKNRVKRIHVHPLYDDRTHDNNLALLEFPQSVDYLQLPDVSPACRSKLESSVGEISDCWTPVRNKTTIQRFDALEGKTVSENLIQMTEMPIKLVLNPGASCPGMPSTRHIEYTPSNHICLAEYKFQQASLRKHSYYGSGIYCNNHGTLSLVSLVQPTYSDDSTSAGYLDINFYNDWFKEIMQDS